MLPQSAFIWSEVIHKTRRLYGNKKKRRPRALYIERCMTISLMIIEIALEWMEYMVVSMIDDKGSRSDYELRISAVGCVTNHTTHVYLELSRRPALLSPAIHSTFFATSRHCDEAESRLALAVKRLLFLHFWSLIFSLIRTRNDCENKSPKRRAQLHG